MCEGGSRELYGANAVSRSRAIGWSASVSARSLAAGSIVPAERPDVRRRGVEAEAEDEPEPEREHRQKVPPMSFTNPSIPMSFDQFVTWPRNSVECGWWKTRIQPTATSVGTNASRKTLGEKRRPPPLRPAAEQLRERHHEPGAREDPVDGPVAARRRVADVRRQPGEQSRLTPTAEQT